MTEPRDRSIDVRGLRLFVRDRGPLDGPPVLLVHGWLDSGATFDRLAPLLGDGLRTIAVDLRGHGQSDWIGPGCFYHYVDYLGDLDGLLDALGVQRPVRLIGHSLGGGLSLVYSAARPERVLHASLLDGLPFLIPPTEVVARVGAYLDDLARPRLRGRVASVAEAAERMRRAQPGLPEEIALHLAAAAVAPDPAQGGALAWRFDPRLRSKSPLPMTVEVLRCLVAWLSTPLLVLRSGFSPVPPEEETSSFLAAVRAPVTIATLPGTSHHLHLERPEEVAGRIRSAWAVEGC